MNIEKRKQYQLTASFHTLAIRFKGNVDLLKLNEEVNRCIDTRSRTVNGETITTVKINPNKLNGDVFTFAEFTHALGTIFDAMNVRRYEILRADLRFDSYEPNHYTHFAKLNRYLISALVMTYSIRNKYRTEDLINQNLLSMAAKNKYFELEIYDKFSESDGKDPAMSRLEERSKMIIDNDLRTEFIEHWSLRWNKALSNLQNVQTAYNDALEAIYKDENNKKQWSGLTGFLLQYQDCIFTESQLIDLFYRLGADTPKKRANSFKRRWKPEFFSMDDVNFAVKEIERATAAFFG